MNPSVSAAHSNRDTRYARDLHANRDLYALSAYDDSAPVSVYSGFIELLDKFYLATGYLKVRVPIIHLERPVDWLPWARLSPDLLVLSRAWDRTGPLPGDVWAGVPPYNEFRGHAVESGRSGRHLLRKGDRVECLFIDGNLNFIYVTRILEFRGGDEGAGVYPINMRNSGGFG
jgi:hypothetical protein